MPRISQKSKQTKRANWIVLTTAILLVIFVIIFIFWSQPQTDDNQLSSDDTQTTQPDTSAIVRDFYECQDAGFPVQESLPAQCTDANGVKYVQPIGTYQDNLDDIYIERPLLGEQISSPVTISGRARGTWFFEAEFLVELKDDTGELLAQGIARTTADWMTEELVPFSLVLTFERPLATDRGEIIFEASNPSDLSEFAKSMRYPIRFATN